MLPGSPLQNRTDAPASRVDRLIDGVSHHACRDQGEEPPAVDQAPEPDHRLAAAGSLIRVMTHGRADQEHAERRDQAAAYCHSEPADALNRRPHVTPEAPGV